MCLTGMRMEPRFSVPLTRAGPQTRNDATGSTRRRTMVKAFSDPLADVGRLLPRRHVSNIFKCDKQGVLCRPTRHKMRAGGVAVRPKLPPSVGGEATGLLPGAPAQSPSAHIRLHRRQGHRQQAFGSAIHPVSLPVAAGGKGAFPIQAPLYHYLNGWLPLLAHRPLTRRPPTPSFVS